MIHMPGLAQEISSTSKESNLMLEEKIDIKNNTLDIQIHVALGPQNHEK